MFRITFGKKELNGMKQRERQRLLKEGKQELERALESIPIIGEPTTVTPKAYGFLLYHGAKEKTVNEPIDNGFRHVCSHKGIEYCVITDRKV